MRAVLEAGPSQRRWARRRGRWLQDAAGLLTSIAVGTLFASLLALDVAPQRPDVDAWQIFTHNIAIALLLIAGTRYAALPVVLFNGFFLGAGLYASTVLNGWPMTLGRTVVHVPLEVLAWLLTVHAASAAGPAYRGVRHRGGRRAALALVARRTALTAGVYAAAAAAEHLELVLTQP